jgi:alpha-tubulin suppressor-like RCC1 family protein
MREQDTHIVSVSAGHTFSLFLTNSGQVYASGSSESGQLGNGKTGEPADSFSWEVGLTRL